MWSWSLFKQTEELNLHLNQRTSLNSWADINKIKTSESKYPYGKLIGDTNWPIAYEIYILIISKFEKICVAIK